MKKNFLAITVMALALFLACQASAEVKIGVLAKNGALKALKKWDATGEYLSKQLGEPVKIVPLSFDEVNPAIQGNTVDFFLINSSMFMTAKVKYGASAVATMINSRQGQALSSFGGVIFTQADNKDINSLQNLKGKKFGAVKLSSFGGWQMAQKEMLDAGIDVIKSVETLRFMEKHDEVVRIVLSGGLDAGTVRTDTLERMAAAGTISMSSLKIINSKNYVDFPFVCSTTLYPEWPLAKTSKTSYSLGTRVAEALKLLSPDDNATKKAKIVGWTDPLDYSGVEALQRELKVGGYKR